MSAPFIVYGLPRSRTFWLSVFLTYGDVKCYHEMCMVMRDVDDIKSWLAQDNTGTSETAASPAWRLIHHYRPDIKAVVVRRPVEHVVEAVLALDISGVGRYNRETLTKSMEYLDRMLDQVERLPGVMRVDFDDLRHESTCAEIFEFCLPYKHNPQRWESLSKINLQVNSRALLRYRFAHRPQMSRFKALCWGEMRRLYKMGAFRDRIAA